MAINVSDLPPKYQAQAMKKYMEQQKQRRGPAPPAAPPQDLEKGTKYHNTPTERVTASGAVLHFDSQKEARRFDVLAARQARGQIRDLRLPGGFHPAGSVYRHGGKAGAGDPLQGGFYILPAAKQAAIRKSCAILRRTKRGALGVRRGGRKEQGHQNGQVCHEKRKC